MEVGRLKKTNCPVSKCMYDSNVFFFVFCRISDRGGGIPNNIVNKVFQYNFTTAQDNLDPRVTGGTFGALTNVTAGTTPGPLCGYVHILTLLLVNHKTRGLFHKDSPTTPYDLL